jgi:hypothetical protein
MTAVWGPLGWMTLHSVSTLYPETPTDAEKALLKSWLEMFRDTITCPHCNEHFRDMLAKYQIKFPGMLNSRREFMAFAFRAHNTVNRRLNKPIYNTLDQCMETLKKNVTLRSAVEYRNAYLVHIRRDWGRRQDTSGIVAVRKIMEMIKIENEYFKPRDTNFNVHIENIEVVLPYGIIENVEESIFARRVARRTVVTSSPAPAAVQATPTKYDALRVRVTSRGIRLR